MTTHPYDIGRLYRDYSHKLRGALRTHFDTSALSHQDVEDVVQDLFVELQKRETKIISQPTFGSLLKITVRDALDLLRRRNSQKRGGKMLSSLEKALEQGSDFPEVNLTPKSEALETADFVIAATIPMLSERELILINYIRAAAPYSEMTLSDLVDSLAEEERARFLPVCGSLSTEDEQAFIIKQVSRSRSALRRRLRVVRDAMSDQGS